MRTTVTLDDDTADLVAQRMRDHGVSFKQALNDSIRAGAPDPDRGVVRTRTADLGTPAVALDRALQLAGDLEDDDLVRRMREGR